MTTSSYAPAKSATVLCQSSMGEISHAAMMQVVLMLAGAETGAPSIPVIVLGNLFVCGMEGLIVGIQVLRLEYYELFSRFYKGSGREFKPFYEK